MTSLKPAAIRFTLKCLQEPTRQSGVWLLHMDYLVDFLLQQVSFYLSLIIIWIKNIQNLGQNRELNPEPQVPKALTLCYATTMQLTSLNFYPINVNKDRSNLYYSSSALIFVDGTKCFQQTVSILDIYRHVYIMLE